MIGVERTDFATVVTQDKERALAFYGETLGLPRNPNSHDEWPEFETGNLTLAVFSDPDGNRLILHRRYAPYDDGSTP